MEKYQNLSQICDIQICNLYVCVERIKRVCTRCAYNVMEHTFHFSLKCRIIGLKYCQYYVKLQNNQYFEMYVLLFKLF